MNNKLICILNQTGEVLFWGNFPRDKAQIIRNLTFNGRPIECHYSYSNMKEKIEFKYLDNGPLSRPQLFITPIDVTYKNQRARLMVIDKKDIEFKV